MQKLLLMTTICAVSLSGCAFRTQTVGMAVDHNEFVAQATNRQTVLNILRASHREPMHFTRLSQVRGTMRLESNLGLSTVIGGGSGSIATTNDGMGVTTQSVDTDSFGATNYTPSFSVQVNTGTDFDIAIEDDEEFYRGIINPLADTTVVHYLRQGLPRDLLTFLLVNQIDFYAYIVPPKGRENSIAERNRRIRLENLRNIPDDEDEDFDFEIVARCWQLDTRVNTTKQRTISFPELSTIANIDGEVLARIRSAPGAEPAADRLPDDRQMEPGQTSRNAPSYQYGFPAGRRLALTLAEARNSECAGIYSSLFQLFANSTEVERALLGSFENGAGELIDNLFTANAVSELADEGLSIEEFEFGGRPTVESSSSVGEELTGAGAPTAHVPNFFDRALSPTLRARGYHAHLEAELSLRSVQGIIYYLGEYARTSENRPLLRSGNPRQECFRGELQPGRGDASHCLPILTIGAAHEITNTRFVEVEYRGNHYAVPLSGQLLNRTAGRSSQVISLVHQLLNLHRSAENLPSTPLVRISN